jgi:N-acetylmuramoyl-L-alanine amidase
MLRDEAGRWALPALCLICFALVIFFLLRLGTYLSPAHSRASPTHIAGTESAMLPLRGVTLVLDPGHGGADSGARCNGVCEASLTYRTADEVAQAVRQAGGKVVFTVRSRALNPTYAVTEPPLVYPADAVLASTGAPLRIRHGDSPQALWLRAAVARRLWHTCSDRADRNTVFLSLHYDEYGASSVSGALVCVDRRMPSVPRFAQILAAEMCADGIARPDVWHGLRGICARHLGVLDPNVNPVDQRALLELATISNTGDAARAVDPTWRKQMAARIVSALIRLRSYGTARGHPAVQ